MEIVFDLFREVATLVLLICLGGYARKKGIFTEDTARRLADFLIVIIIPVLMVYSMQRERNPEQIAGFWVSVAFSALVLTLTAAASAEIFRRGPSPEKSAAQRLAAVFPNCAFMGVPLLTAVAGEASIIYCMGFIGVFNVMTWCWAAPLLDGKKRPASLMILNPGTASFVIGAALFLLEIRLPRIILSLMGQIAAVNTPISMMMIGVFLAGVELKGIFEAGVIKTVFVRNLCVPAISLLAIYACGVSQRFGRDCALGLVILSACSSAASALLLPIRAGHGGEYPAKLVAASNLALLATMPFIAFLAQGIL